MEKKKNVEKVEKFPSQIYFFGGFWGSKGKTKQ